MAWSVFSRKSPSRRPLRAGECRVTRTGSFLFHRADIEAAGLDGYCCVLVDAENERLGLRALAADENTSDHGFPVRFADPVADTAQVNLLLIFKRYGWQVPAKQKPKFGPACTCYVRQGGADGPPLLVVKMSKKGDGED